MGRSCMDPCPKSVFFSIGHSRGLLHPAVSVALFDAHISPKAEKAKTQRWRERDGGKTEEEGGRREGGVRNGEV